MFQVEVFKTESIEAAYAVFRRKPDVSFPVLKNGIYSIAGQAVGSADLSVSEITSQYLSWKEGNAPKKKQR